MKVWLIGEHNPYGPDPQHALYPSPPGCAGARLREVLGLTVGQYPKRFERRNLLLEEQAEGDGLVLLGAKVSAAFGFEFQKNLCEVQDTYVYGEYERKVVVVPHPSGLSPAWNDKAMAPRARAAVEKLSPEVFRP